MLRKLLKHEFRATSRIMGPLYLILLVTAVGANLSSRMMLDSDSELLNILGGLLVMAFVVAIIGVCVMSLVLMIQRFYKNLMGDEGYVMFTLPVSVHQHVWSKLIVSSVWFIASGIAVTLSFVIMVYEVGFMGRFLQELGELLHQLNAYYALNGTAIALEFLILLFFGCAVACLQFYAAMAVGHSFANHKALLSVAAYFGFQIVLQILGSFLLVGLDHVDFFWNLNFQVDGMAAVHLGMAVLIAGTVLYGAIFYLITTITLKKRLNLE